MITLIIVIGFLFLIGGSVHIQKRLDKILERIDKLEERILDLDKDN